MGPGPQYHDQHQPTQIGDLSNPTFCIMFYEEANDSFRYLWWFLLCWYGTDHYFLHCLICIRLREVFNKHILQEIIFTDPWDLVKWCTLTKRTYWDWVKMSTHMSRWWQNLDNLENWLKNAFAFASYGWVTCCLCQIKLTKQTESELVYAWDITALHLRECK